MRLVVIRVAKVSGVPSRAMLRGHVWVRLCHCRSRGPRFRNEIGHQTSSLGP